MEKNIAVIKGDGIGPEIVTEAMKVLDAVAKKYNHKFNYTEILMGGCSIDAYGVPLSDEALKIAKLYNCKKAILKEKSPSCGCGKIYDGTFSRNLIVGNGVTADLLLKNGIEVFGESEIDKLK